LRANSKPILLIFADPDCGPCQALLPEIGHWQRTYVGKLTLAILSRGTPKANRKAARQAATHVLLQQDNEVAEAYQSDGTPSAVLVLPDGTIGSPLAPGVGAIQALLAKVVDTAMPVTTGMDGHMAASAELS
jgi:protein-disulfide isomerase